LTILIDFIIVFFSLTFLGWSSYVFLSLLYFLLFFFFFFKKKKGPERNNYRLKEEDGLSGCKRTGNKGREKVGGIANRQRE
jgi:hypothetical protein